MQQQYMLLAFLNAEGKIFFLAFDSAYMLFIWSKAGRFT